MKVLGWGKPHGYDRGIRTPFHAVVAIIGRAFVTACTGRWSMGSPAELDDKRGDHDERWTFYPVSHVIAEIERRPFPYSGDGWSYFCEPCPKCIDELLKPRALSRAEMALALARGTELVRNAEVR